MDAETNSFVRRILAGVLFIGGILWAFFATGILFQNFLKGAEAKVGALTIFGVGSVVWVSWGIVAFSQMKRTWELIVWFVSATYHLAVLARSSAHRSAPGDSSRYW